MPYFIKTRSVIGAALAACCIACGAFATAAPPPGIVSNSSIHVDLRAEADGPRLAWIEAAQRNRVKDRPWINSGGERLPATVEVNGAAVQVKWRLRPELAEAGGNLHKVVFVYECAEPHLRLRWQWEARADFGPVEHRITIQNLGGQQVWLPMVDSLRLAWRVAPHHDIRNAYVEKGADTPSNLGTHLDSVADGYNWEGKSSTYAHPEPGEKREIIPAEIVYDSNDGGWYAGIEFSGRTRIALEQKGGSLQSVLGLDPEPGPFKTRLEPGETFVTPTVFLGAFRGGPDGAGNQLRPWVRAVLGNPLTWKDAQYPLMVNNSWGSGMQVDEKLALKMIDESKELGLEMFHVDAGWFRGVGDWYPDPVKFPHGLALIADAAHSHGLRFGIWTDWTQAGVDTQPGALNVRDPKVRDWTVTDLPPDWKPEEFKGQTVDIGVPAAHEYAAHEVDRIVTDYHLDMLEHDGYLVAQGCVRDDHPHAAPNRSTMRITHDSGFDFVTASNSTDVSYHAVRAYYDIYEKTRRQHPGLLFEICNDGGRMVDFGSAAHGDYFSITDTYDPLSNRRAFYDTSHLLPAAMLESYVEKWPVANPENFLYMLRSGMMGWITIMTDTTAWTPQQHDAAREAFTLYKNELRPLIRDAQMFHIAPRPDGVHWDGLEYWDPARRKGVVYAFRGSVPDQPEHRFVLAGLKDSKRYHLHFEDGSQPDREVQGSQLLGQGLSVHLQSPLSSELVFLNEIATQK